MGMQTPGMQFMGQPQFMGMRGPGPQFPADLQKQMAEEHQWGFTYSNFLKIVCAAELFSDQCVFVVSVWSSSRRCWRRTGGEDSLRNKSRNYVFWAASNQKWGLKRRSEIITEHVHFILFKEICFKKMFNSLVLLVKEPHIPKHLKFLSTNQCIIFLFNHLEFCALM